MTLSSGDKYSSSAWLRALGLARREAASDRSEMDHIFQKSLPRAPWMQPAMARLPGVQPLDWAAWLEVDDAFGAQMALRDHLLSSRRHDVYTLTDPAETAAHELLALIVDRLGPGYLREEGRVIRPDGVTVPLGAEPPLITAARLVQEDLCLLQASDAGHVLTGAVLCFPASWTLSEKIGRPLIAIHGPVDVYTQTMAARVQRLFDAIRPDRPLWRQNALLYADPALHQPRREAAPRDDSARERRYVRSEKQCLIRLPQTGAVVFSIHTYVVPVSALDPAARAALAQMEPHA